MNRRILRASVSVIVPVYNGEKTIRNCLDSLINQSQKRIKIICVNDGSTDGTLEILNEYKRKYLKIRVLNRKNGGRSVARNAGLQAVRTKYVMFCDSDDWYEYNMCENMVDAIKKSDVDLAICGVNMVYEAHMEMKDSDEGYYRVYYSGEKEINDEIIIKTNGSVCNKIFRMDIVRKNGIVFPDELSTAEDYYFYSAYMSVSDKVYFLNQGLYNYRRHTDSIMSENFSKKKMSMDDVLMAKELFKFYKKTGFLKDHKDLFWRQWIASFWASYRYSPRKFHWMVKKEAKAFLDKNFEKYKPADSELIAWKKDIEVTMKKIRKDYNGKK